ncbi:MAG: dnaB [Myxococcales bacterium]|nr:dnaB [Myxococcales bacterium]
MQFAATQESSRPTPPHSQEAEESVIGGILVHARKFNDVAEFLVPDDFYHPALRAIFEAMVELDSSSKPIDALTVVEQMRALETFEKLRAFNSADYLTELMSKIVTAENIGYHARIIRGKATARRLVEACREIAARGYGEYGDVDEYIDAAEREIFEIASRSQKQSFEPIKQILYTTIKALEKRYERKQAVTGVPTGYHKLDAMTAGMQPGDLVIIAARPSMGKTSFVMNMVLNAAMQKDPATGKHPFPALVFSLEMSKESLCERLLCSEARVDSMKLRGGFLETKDWIRITTAAGKLAEAPILIDDSGSPTLLEIRAKARRWRADNNLFYGDHEQMGVIVIDYLQLVQGRATKDDNRQREISEISRGLKALAKELRVPVIALSQLNRSLESRADKRPMLSDLRESGAIAQDADVIAFIYRDEVYSKDECKEEDKGVAEIIIGKQRNGPTGHVRLAFLNMYTRFENIAEGRD